MTLCSGYQTLALLLRKKKTLLNSHILHLCITLAGSGEARESSAIPNTPAFNDLLCDLEVGFIKLDYSTIDFGLIGFDKLT